MDLPKHKEAIMKNRFCKLFLLLTAALMVLLAPFGTAQGGEGPTFVYVEVDGKAVITGYYGSEQQVVIPGTIDGFTVVEIEREAFMGNADMISVTVPGSVRKIGKSAFEGCSNLRSLNLANGLDTIDIYAFSETGLVSVRLPDSLITLGDSAFSGSGQLQEVYLPKGLINIGDSAFWGCDYDFWLFVYKDSPGHEYAHNYGFQYKILIESISLSDVSVEQGKKVQLSPVVLPDIAHNKNLTWASSDNSIATVDANGLVTGVKPGEATITSTAKDGSGVSAQCSLTVCHKAAGDFVYEDLGSAIRIADYTGSAAEVQVPGKIVGKPVTEIGQCAFSNKAGITKIILPESIKIIEEGAFLRCGQLKTINLPAGLTSIGNNSFRECLSLTSITIPDSVSRLEEAVFLNCSGLTQVKLPGKLKSIPPSLFLRCSNLRDIALPVSLTSIGDSAFGDCASLASITIRAHVASFGDGVFLRTPVTIYGDVPSAAKEYADKNKIPFVDLAKVLPGDANNDGRVDINDLTCLIDYLVKGAACPSMKNADANSSGGNPDIEDLKTIINMIIAP
jgi:hypothetical protein